MPPQQLPHLLISKPDIEPGYKSRSGGGGSGPNYPPRTDVLEHGKYLRRRLDESWEQASANEQVIHAKTRSGIYLEFRGQAGYDLAIQSLEDMPSKVRLLNIRSSPTHTSERDEPPPPLTPMATVYAPKEAYRVYADKLDDLLNKTTPSGKPLNAPLFSSIEDISIALRAESFWTDSTTYLPRDEPEWCEAWLKVDLEPGIIDEATSSKLVVEQFVQLVNTLGVDVKEGYVTFPERAVVLIRASEAQLSQIVQHSDAIAEFRLAKETAEFWVTLENREQAEWVTDALGRLRVDQGTDVSVCILDAGVNSGHPLLAPVLALEDCQAIYPEWGVHDHDKQGHGTGMAGLAAYGDLQQCLSRLGAIQISHRLESVKLLPPRGVNEPELWADLTAQAISRAEIKAPERKRIVCMAVAASDTRDRGRPTSWSAGLDQLAAGVPDDSQPRLIIVCAGNISDSNVAVNYPDAQLTDSVHDPGQAWNALTVGAYTDLTTISPTLHGKPDPLFDGLQVIAPAGGLSPFSTTSFTWDKPWPYKPDIVMEGGNLAYDGANFVDDKLPQLSVLTTSNRADTSLTHFNMTSAATAQAAWYAAKVQSTYPAFWPETIRALLVHSAEWTPAMRAMFDTTNKTDRARLLRVVGYGVPDLDRAMYSAANSLTLIAQQVLTPFKVGSSDQDSPNNMHFFRLPWPVEALQSLADDASVSMRVTLSYFIEPGPGVIDSSTHYRYRSHGLNFEINAPGESETSFLARINAAMKFDGEGGSNPSTSKHWRIGRDNRVRGSLHSDTWEGTAAELASSNLLAVYPTIGWWRTRTNLRRQNSEARYSLVVSIQTDAEDVDIYTPVAIQIAIPVPVTTT